MGTTALGISGRLLEGQTLTANPLGTVSGLQWQVLNNGAWTNVGTAGSLTFLVPNGASGKTYRVTGSSVDGAIASDATATVRSDTNKLRTPVISGGAITSNLTEQAAPAAVLAPLSFSDADTTDYGGGSLRVLNSNATSRGGDGQDILGFITGTGVGQFSYNAATGILSYGLTATHTAIGTVTSTVGGDLVVNFNTSASKAVVDALVDKISFSSNDDTPQGARLLTLRITDSTGRTAQQSMTVNVAAVNDMPVFTSASTFTADENQTQVGLLRAADPDSPTEPLSYTLVSGTGATHNALFNLDESTGLLRFNTAPDFEAGSPSYSVRVRATDTAGGLAEQVVAVNVKNVNEAPVAQALAATIAEDATAPIQLQAAFTDPDGAAGGGHVITFNASSTVGTVSLSGTAFTYTPSPSFNALAAGQTLTDVFSYTVTDAGGLSSTRTASITVNGANDLATITGADAGSVTEDTNLVGSPLGDLLVATGQLAISDPDAGQSKFQAAQYSTLLGGSLAITEDGAWRYEVINSGAIQTLAEGASRTDTAVVRSLDGATQRTVTITWNGKNDAAVITGPAMVVLSREDLGSPVRAYGRLTVADADLGQGSFEIVTREKGPANIGVFTIAADGRWEWEAPIDNPAIIATPDGQYLDDRYVFRSADGSTTQEVVVRVTGANQEATFTNTQDRPMVEDQPDADGKLRTSGRLLVNDPDTGESVVSTTGTQHWVMGTFTIDAQGFWTYEIEATHPYLQWVGGESFQIATLDGTTTWVSVNLTKAPDAPIITAAGQGAVVEAGHAPDGQVTPGTSSAAGQLQANDADTPPGYSPWVRWSGSRDGTYGAFTINATTGAWTYQLDNTRAATQALRDGEQVVESFDVIGRDYDYSYLFDTKPVAITIQGANDHPVVLAGGTSGEVSEGAPTTPASGQLQATDPDGTFLVWGEQNVMGLYGNFHLGADGAWNYLLDAGDLDTVALGLGQSGVDTFEARVQDQLGAFATVQVAVNVLGA